MNVNGLSTKNSGLQLQGDESVTVPQITKIRPRDDNAVDIGSSTKRFKTIYYETLDPVPGGGSGGPFLPLDGTSAMTGSLSMGAQEMKNVAAIRPSTTNTIIGNSAIANGTHNVIIGDSASSTVGTGGSVSIGYSSLASNNDAVAIGPSASANGTNCVAVGKSASCVSSDNVSVGKAATCSAAKGVSIGCDSSCADNGVTVGRLSGSSANFAVVLGPQSSSGAFRSIVVGPLSTSSAAGAHVIGDTLTNSTANSLLVGSSANIRSSTSTCDLGTTLLPFQSLYLNSNIAGPTNSRTADNIVSNASTGTAGNLPTFVSAKVIGDSGIALSSLATNAAVALKADLASPALTGIPTAPTATSATNTTQLATTAFVTTADNLKANLASPTFTGVPAGPTAAALTNTTQLATTAFVTTADNLKADLASPTFTGIPLAPTAAALTNTTQLATTAFVTTADNLKANLASPTFTGVPLAPTAAALTNTTQLATTAFVTTADNLKANLAAPTFTGVVAMTDVTDSVSTSTGALVLSGGLGIAKNIFCGASISLNNNVSCNTVNCTKINSTTTSLFFGAAIGPYTVNFTANTAKLVDTGTLTEISDPAAEFTPTASTGRVQYTGATTRYFHVRILYNVAATSSSQTYTGWVSKNGSLTQVAARTMNFTATTPVAYVPFEVSAVYQLSTNDTIQLAAQYTSTATANIFEIAVLILPVI